MSSVPAVAERWLRARRATVSAELWWLAGAVALGLAVRLIYVLSTQHYPLFGDPAEYDAEGQLIAHGHLFWTSLPYGIPHAGAWKAPGYPAWLGLWYALLGHHVVAVRLLQVPLGAATIGLAWLLARRLFGTRVARVAAFVVALYPLAWQYEGLLYAESLATPLTAGLLVLIFTGKPSPRRAVVTGALLGLTLLIRPSSEFVLAGAMVGWSLRMGWRRGLALTLMATVVALLIVAPWTIRNAVVVHGFVPISLQDAAAYGTFNAQAAHDPLFPYAWRREPPGYADLFDPRHPLSDVALRSRLNHRALDYVSHHPGSVFAAFFWNGLSRLWDIRRRSRSLAEVPFEGRSRFVTDLGLDAYTVLLPLSLLGLWRARRRRGLTLGLLAVALGASVVFTVDSGTRYRAPLEPVIGVLACAGALGARDPCASAGARVVHD
ncbi:MAG: glycosyltransferase family 39 protein [Actinomycetota bacterium]|nr:glycosyltransferase family 39 protein [Actinomycetota bacterium]